jgi:hypothetical protein
MIAKFAAARFWRYLPRLARAHFTELVEKQGPAVKHQHRAKFARQRGGKNFPVFPTCPFLLGHPFTNFRAICPPVLPGFQAKSMIRFAISSDGYVLTNTTWWIG